MRRVLIIAIAWLSASTPSWAATGSYTFISPPRANRAEAVAVYGKIARFLTRATGASIVFHYTSNWLSYMADVRANTADIYFDGPAFIGWRVAHFHDHAAVALAGHLNFVLVTKKNGPPITKITDLVGHSVCAFSPPNLATLRLDSWFTNPARQPYYVIIHSFADAAHNIIGGGCVGALEPLPVYKRQAARSPGALTIAYRAPGIPNQGFSINARVPRALRQKIVQALLSPAGLAATKPLRDMFGHKSLVAVQDQTYLPYRKLLHVMVGF